MTLVAVLWQLPTPFQITKIGENARDRYKDMTEKCSHGTILGVANKTMGCIGENIACVASVWENERE